jgi:hypothetical protein
MCAFVGLRCGDSRSVFINKFLMYDDDDDSGDNCYRYY